MITWYKHYFMETSTSAITKWFLIIGKIEGYSYLLLLFIAMPLKYFFKMPLYIRPCGSLHGVLFVAFITLLALMFFKEKLSFKMSALALILSLIPFGIFF